VENPKEKGKNLVVWMDCCSGRKNTLETGVGLVFVGGGHDYNHGYRDPKPMYPRPALTSKAESN
jgi:hypothetical protein